MDKKKIMNWVIYAVYKFVAKQINSRFEDIAPMPYDISEQEIIWQVDKLLL